MKELNNFIKKDKCGHNQIIGIPLRGPRYRDPRRVENDDDDTPFNPNDFRDWMTSHKGLRIARTNR